MSAIKFAIGDIVKLKSEGPWTTVVHDKPAEGSKFVKVAWFDGSALKDAVLPKVTLEHDPKRKTAEAPAA